MILVQRLDEVQTYVLLRRWQLENMAEVLATQLTAAQLESLMNYYHTERLSVGWSQKMLIYLSRSGSSCFDPICSACCVTCAIHAIS